MTLIDFIKENDVYYSYNRVEESFICEMEKKLGTTVGVQLKKYILDYGYLGYKYVELFGVNNHLGLNSNMIKKTKMLNERFNKTKKLIAIENQGDGDYYLVDEKDFVYRFIEDTDEIIPQNINLFEYILKRFLVAQGG